MKVETLVEKLVNLKVVMWAVELVALLVVLRDETMAEVKVAMTAAGLADLLVVRMVDVTGQQQVVAKVDLTAEMKVAHSENCMVVKLVAAMAASWDKMTADYLAEQWAA